MGPSLIFDKSALESFSPDEAMWLDNFFNTNITPLFFIETLADLEKEIRSGRTPEQVVGSIARKTPDMSSACNVHHTSLLAGELSGDNVVKMFDGRPIISGGHTVELGGKTGVIFQQTPEEEAFQRWQRGEFLDLERMQAKKWRRGLSNINLELTYKIFQVFFPMGKPKNLVDVKRMVDFYLDGPDQEEVLSFGLKLLDVPEHSQILVIERWKEAGKPKVCIFAPYFSHVFAVDFFFSLAVAADLVGRGRPSHKIDLAYLYYLPFCDVFTSQDKLHREIVPFFLREDQIFLWGADLKKDLLKLDLHYSGLPEDVKARGVMSFAYYPPLEGDFLISKLWDKYMSQNWRQNPVMPKPQSSNAKSKEIMEEVRKFETGAIPISPEAIPDSDLAHHIIMKRTVSGHRGKWVRFPPEVMNRHKNENGEWENN